MIQSDIDGLCKVAVSEILARDFKVCSIVDVNQGNRILIKSANGQEHECLTRFLDLDQARSIQILKSEFDYKIKENRWIILGLFMEAMDLVFYMIPLKVFKTPNNYFIDNEQPTRWSHMSNWEIKIYLKAIPELSKYSLINSLDSLKSK